ncbi:MAG: heme ABC exporter ATP-binding protein CcmA [Bacillota bacterium]
MPDRGAAVSRGAAVVVRDLVQRLGGHEVLRGVSFELRAGEVLAVLGPNGAGKSTLLRVLGTLLRPTRGEVLVRGRDVRRSGPDLRRSIGFLGHHTFLYPQLTGWENLWFCARAFGVSDPETRVKEMLGAVGLDLFAHEPVRHYSRGMQQRLALARALLHDPLLLLLDEPYTGLDPEAAGLLDEVIGRWREQSRSVVMTTHDLGRALSGSDRVLVLQRGRVVLLAPSRSVGASRLEEACRPGGHRA